jgi:hypothetical protein
VSGYANPKVDRMLDACSDFTERDFADLAVAASDQAMLDVQGQAALRVLLDTKRGRACETDVLADADLREQLAIAIHRASEAEKLAEERAATIRLERAAALVVSRNLDTATARVDALEYAATEAGAAFATQLVARFSDTATLRSAVLETIRTEMIALKLCATSMDAEHMAGNVAQAVIVYAEGETVVVDVDGKAA